MNLTPTIQAFTQAGIDTPQLDAQLLMAHVLGITREALLMRGQGEVMTPAQTVAFEALVARRLAREPMAQILGKKEFWGLDFEVTKDTLMPRPDSETLIESLLSTIDHRPSTILDLGTGTGCLLLSALKEFPQARGLGVDISEAALKVARRNAAALGLENRAEFKKSDWTSEINAVWDVVISNPPYIPEEEIPHLAPEVARYEPRLALDGGRDGLDCYRTITRFLPNILAKNGVCVLEVGAGQADAVASLAVAKGLYVAEIRADLAGIPRCIVITREHS